MNTIIKTGALIALLAMASSCSVLNSNKKADNKINGAQATKVDETTTTPTPTQPATSTTQPEKTKPAPQEVKKDPTVGQRLGGKWTIIKAGNMTIDRDEDMPYIIFEPSTSLFYASNGCNTLNGAYALDSLNRLSFRNVMSTLRACPDVKYETQINALLSESPTVIKISDTGSESFLDFVGKDGVSMMRLRRGNLQFLNGQWDVESIAGLKKLEVPASLFFDIAELRLHGNTGCNIVNGDIYLDHRHPNSVDFSNMGTTRMACPYEKQQTAMLVALEESATAINDGADKVILLNTDGKILMTLKKADHIYEE